MKGGRRTSKGRIINLDDVIAASPHATAVGNMRVNAQGDKLGHGGEVSESREKRTRAYYKNHPQSSNQKVSLKGEMQEAFSQGHSDLGDLKPATGDTHMENTRTSPARQTEKSKEPVQVPVTDTEPEEFSDIEMPYDEQYQYTSDLDGNGDYLTDPAGYEEVEMENGDIVMKPYWLIQDDDNDDDA